ncbi:MAG: DUF2188 domain-containing protein [Steroidobacteraceae bacterium]
MSKKAVHVVPHSGGWATRTEGSGRVGSIHSTQRDAIERGRDQAIRRGTELKIHGENGRIRDSDSYGNDPCPPKDRKF